MLSEPSRQTFRGLACLLLVLYHVVGDDGSRGLGIDEGWLRWMNDGLACVRMPLFAFIAGSVHGLYQRRIGLSGLMRAKARRLLLPMLVVGTLYALTQSLHPASHRTIDWTRVHIEPVDHFWYVEALFWVTLVLAWADRARERLPDPWFWAVAAAALVWTQWIALPRTLAIEQAAYLLPYAAAGCVWVRCPERAAALRSTQARTLLIAAALIALLLMGLPQPNPERRTTLMLASGLSLCLLCAGLSWQSSVLMRIGADAYPVFLFHVFFTAGMRSLLQVGGVQSIWMHILLGLALGLVGPMLLARWIRTQPLLALVCLGERRAASARRTVELRAVA